MRTDRFAFDLLDVEESGLLTRSVTVCVTNVADDPVADVSIALTVSADGSPVETFRASLDALDPGASCEVTRELSVSLVEGLSLKAHGADLDVVVMADGVREETSGSLSV